MEMKASGFLESPGSYRPLKKSTTKTSFKPHKKEQANNRHLTPTADR